MKRLRRIVGGGRNEAEEVEEESHEPDPEPPPSASTKAPAKAAPGSGDGGTGAASGARPAGGAGAGADGGQKAKPGGAGRHAAAETATKTGSGTSGGPARTASPTESAAPASKVTAAPATTSEPGTPAPPAEAAETGAAAAPGPVPGPGTGTGPEEALADLAAVAEPLEAAAGAASAAGAPGVPNALAAPGAFAEDALAAAASIDAQLPETEPGGPEPVAFVGVPKTKWIALDGAWETTQRGRQVMNDPRLFRGVAFTDEERRELGLVGLLPPHAVTMQDQVSRALGQYHAQPTDLAKHVYLSLLQDRNEVLFYRLLLDNLPEMMPIVYTPTVGEAISHYSQEYRRPRGVFLSVDHPEDIEQSLMAPGLGGDDVDLLVVTDGEAILGIGDWGVGGINISVGKLSLYTAAGGIDPGRAIPVVLDMGTNRESLLEDPLYLGNRHARVEQAQYDDFIDAFVEATSRLFPNALVHWEDLAAHNARRVLHRWRDNTFTFNDDMQGTGAVVLAAVLSGLKRTGGRMADQRVVIYGPGTAGIGIAEQLRDAMVADGLSKEEANKCFWCVGRPGLLLESFDVAMRDFQRQWARPDSEVESWNRDDDGTISLTETIRHVEATILIGTSGQPGAFTEDAIRAMALACQHPIILPLSNPSSLVEAEPWDLMQWTGGRALVATGSAFDPVTYAWSTHYIGQANNALVFPGLGFGGTLVGAIQVTDNMLIAAAEAISAQVDMSVEGSPLLPEIYAIRKTSAAVARAVGQAAIDEGVAKWALPEPAEQGVEAAMWRPDYRPIRAV